MTAALKQTNLPVNCRFSFEATPIKIFAEYIVLYGFQLALPCLIHPPHVEDIANIFYRRLMYCKQSSLNPMGCLNKNAFVATLLPSFPYENHFVFCDNVNSAQVF